MKTLIAIPSGGHPDIAFVRSLMQLRRIGETSIAIDENSLVYLNRERLSKAAIECGSEYVLWLDDDMVFGDDLLDRLMKSINLSGADVMTSLFFRRRPPFNPALWERMRPGLTPEDMDVKEYDDYPRDSIFSVEGCGMAATLMRTSVLADIFKECQTVWQPIPGYGEDVSFCLRARKLGKTILCDSSIKVGHVTKTLVTETSYLDHKA